MPKEYVESCFARTLGMNIMVQPDGTSVSQNDMAPPFRALVLWGSNEYVQVATVNPVSEGDQGLYVDLDRKGINDLIRLLRKARDRAYGRDE